MGQCTRVFLCSRIISSLPELILLDELIKLEGAICKVEHVNGSTYTDLHGDLRMNDDGLYHAAA